MATPNYSSAVTSAFKSFTSEDGYYWYALQAFVPDPPQENICLKAFTVNATAVRQVWSPTTSAYYSVVQNAYNAAVTGESLLMQAVEFDENLNLSGNLNVHMSGGYNNSFSSVSGQTTIRGSMTISGGTVTIQNIVVK